MGRIFDMNNTFFRFMSKVADLCILNIICVICCIPVITAGASITAMYYVTLKMVRNEEAYIEVFLNLLSRISNRQRSLI